MKSYAKCCFLLLVAMSLVFTVVTTRFLFLRRDHHHEQQQRWFLGETMTTALASMHGLGPPYNITIGNNEMRNNTTNGNHKHHKNTINTARAGVIVDSINGKGPGVLSAAAAVALPPDSDDDNDGKSNDGKASSKKGRRTRTGATVRNNAAVVVSKNKKTSSGTTASKKQQEEEEPASPADDDGDQSKEQDDDLVDTVTQDKSHLTSGGGNGDGHHHRPPLASLINPYNKTVIGDVQFLLDFAIIGFGKCGTSTLMHWLADHPSEEIQTFRDELAYLMHGEVLELVKELYTELPAGAQYKRGYKSPGEITQAHVLEYFRKYFPQTKLIIGIRHPVPWFESLYNFRVQNLPGTLGRMPPAEKLVGKCFKGMQQTCTDMGLFAYSLIRLGKQYQSPSRIIQQGGTMMTTPLEEEILNRRSRNWYNASGVIPLNNPVFLYEMQQLSDTKKNRTARMRFRKDVTEFLNLTHPLSDDPGHAKPGKTGYPPAEQEKRNRDKINICDSRYAALRGELMELARLNSEWILNSGFLDSPTVRVSDRPYFERLMRSYRADPCSTKSTTTTTKSSSSSL